MEYEDTLRRGEAVLYIAQEIENRLYIDDSDALSHNLGKGKLGNSQSTL